jgi:hypothetical protein
MSAEDEAATEEYQGWVKGQAFATAHLWAFQLFHANCSIEEARALFDSILTSYENSGSPSDVLGPRGMNVKLHGLSHLEQIFEAAILFLKESESRAS